MYERNRHGDQLAQEQDSSGQGDGDIANQLWLSHRKILSKIILASPTQSAMTDVRRGDGRLMSSRANRTAAMIEAKIASVDANRSLTRRSSS